MADSAALYFALVAATERVATIEAVRDNLIADCATWRAWSEECDRSNADLRERLAAAEQERETWRSHVDQETRHAKTLRERLAATSELVLAQDELLAAVCACGAPLGSAPTCSLCGHPPANCGCELGDGSP
jgi:5-methylcytosine-specific restriction endonuclease McrA